MRRASAESAVSKARATRLCSARSVLDDVDTTAATIRKIEAERERHIETSGSLRIETHRVPFRNTADCRRTGSKHCHLSTQMARNLLVSLRLGTELSPEWWLKEHTTSSQPLRVAHLMQYFAIGGLERMVERLSVGSKSRGVESLVIAYLGDGPIRAALEECGVRTLLLDSGPGLHPALILRLRSVLVREQIDVLHTHHLGPFLYGAPAAILAGCARVHTEHSHELYDTTRRRLLGATMSPLAEVVAVTPEVAEFRKHFPGRCQVILNGVPLPADEPQARARGRALLNADQDSFVIGCAARLSAEKNHSGLLDAFAQLLGDEPRSLLACAGDGPLSDALRAKAERAGLSQRVRWLGSVEDMGHFYSALDACVLNSTREGLPLCLLEAMSFGIPVAATEVGGVGALLAEEAGLLVPAQTPDALAGALKSLAAQPELAKKLGRKGKARIRESYSIDNMVDRYVELYRTVGKGAISSVDMESTPCA